jgi:hypothetical protein
MKLVAVESPYAGDIERNLEYLACCMRDCFRHNEAPFASHSLYTREGCLEDDKPEERELGIAAGLAWGDIAEVRVVYTNLGVSEGMKRGIARSQERGQPIEYRELDEEQWDPQPRAIQSGTGWILHPNDRSVRRPR